MKFIQILIVLLFVGTQIHANQKKNNKIGIFDLKYTLDYNLKDSLKVLNLWDDLHAVSTLQGIVNRNSPNLYINYIRESGIEIDSYWWNKYRQKGKWLCGRDTIVYSNIVELITAYKNSIKGCLLYTSPSPRDGLLSRMPSSA